MPKINQKEYDILKGLDDKWKWITRDKDGVLGVYDEKVVKTKFHNFWIMAIKKKIDSTLFSFIQWEDEEPYSIQELIDEYLDDEYGYFNMKLSREFEEFIKKESEETEVKNIEWLKKELNTIKEEAREILDEYDNRGPIVYRFEERLHSVNVFRNLLDQLDEPEVLSQELPVIPKFVADILEENTFADLPTAFEELLSANAGHYYGEDVCKWIVSNEETFARVWLDGYTVEEEQKYYAKLKEIQPPEKEWLTNLSGPNYYAIDTKGLMFGEFILDLVGMKTEASAYTLKDWERHGINDSNADFVAEKDM